MNYNMATKTQTVRKRTVSEESRPHDFAYDPCCMLSSVQDHARAAARAWYQVCDKKYLPIYSRMFSELPNYPSKIICFENHKPNSIFDTHHYRTLPSQDYHEGCTPSLTIEGPYMWKYCRRPILEEATSKTSHNLRMEFLSCASEIMIKKRKQKCSPTMKNKSVQTMFRESETQTDPYSPEFLLVSRTEPEILTLTSLAWGKGLPAGQFEITMIERARNKRQAESSLPLLKRECLEQRLQMIAKIECDEWIYREKQIQDIQTLRMGMLVKLLRHQRDQYLTTVSEKTAIISHKKQKDRKKYLFNLHTKYFQTLRKILVKKKRSTSSFQPREKAIDTIDDDSSKMYNPLLRQGQIPSRCLDDKKITCAYLECYDGLVSLEQTLPENTFTIKCKAPKLALLPKTGYIKRKFKLQKQLEDAYNVIQVEKALNLQKKSMFGISPLMEKLEKPPTRPATPEIRDTTETEEQRELATVFLQKILRGRAVHLMMHNGKERRTDLIKELRTAKALYETDQNSINAAKLELEDEMQSRLNTQSMEEEVESIISSVGGECMLSLLDFLSKELIRLQDERRIHAMALLAERQRRLREAEESGLRQVEERRRREEDEIFRQVMQIHDGSVDVYLEDVLLNSIHQASHEQARQEIQAIAQKINDAAYEFESKRNAMESEELVAELVHSFLIPQIQRSLIQEKVRTKQQAALLAAHNLIYEDLQLPKEKPQPLVEPLEMTVKLSEESSEENGIIVTSAESTWHSTDALETWHPLNRLSDEWNTHPDDVEITDINSLGTPVQSKEFSIPSSNIDGDTDYQQSTETLSSPTQTNYGRQMLKKSHSKSTEDEYD